MTNPYSPQGPPPEHRRPDQPPAPPPKRRIGPRLVISALLIVLLIIFLAENTRSVRMRLIIPEVRAPLFLALLIAAALGALAMVIVRWRRSRRTER